MANERFNLNTIYELAEQYQEENEKLKEKIKKIDDFYAKSKMIMKAILTNYLMRLTI